ncbi:MAG: dimethylsulfonioproprionate lyase family protein [Paracoccaceae bacterium]|nr:dimethylsulfonioproprionate lyase family protein [Paracoccaceae bacterium]
MTTGTAPSHTPMDALLSTVKDVYLNTPALIDFAPWPARLENSGLGHRRMPAEPLITGFAETGTPETDAIVNAIKVASSDAYWTQTYTVEEVGQDFLNRYGYFELLGPTGHFYNDELRGYVGYWGEGLDYGWHNHEAEELYYCLAGEGLFKAEGEADHSLTASQTKYHSSFQKHAMSTSDKPFLCLAFWRGKGMRELPRMAS